MSKRDYQAIARAIHEARSTDAASHWEGDITANVGAMMVTSAVADVLAADNPRFDRARFIEACETGKA